MENTEQQWQGVVHTHFSVHGINDKLVYLYTQNWEITNVYELYKTSFMYAENKILGRILEMETEV